VAPYTTVGRSLFRPPTAVKFDSNGVGFELIDASVTVYRTLTGSRLALRQCVIARAGRLLLRDGMSCWAAASLKRASLLTNPSQKTNGINRHFTSFIYSL
jgi:hypothetical protein